MSVYLRREVDTKESSLIRRSINKAGVTSLCSERTKISEYYRRICVVCVWCSLKATSSFSLSVQWRKRKTSEWARNRLRLDRRFNFQRRGRLSSPLACLLLQGDSQVSKPDLNITSWDMPWRAPYSDDLLELVFIKRIFWFYCYVSCLYLRSTHNSKYFVVPVWAFSVVDEFISTFNVWVNLHFSAQIKAIRKISWVIRV